MPRLPNYSKLEELYQYLKEQCSNSDTKVFHTTYKKLAKYMGVTNESIWRWCAELEKNGCIEQTQICKNSGTYFTIIGEFVISSPTISFKSKQKPKIIIPKEFESSETKLIRHLKEKLNKYKLIKEDDNAYYYIKYKDKK